MPSDRHKPRPNRSVAPVVMEGLENRRLFTAAIGHAEPAAVLSPGVSLSETVISKLPRTLIGTTAVHGAVQVVITNSGDTICTGTVPVDVTFSSVAGRPGTFLAEKAFNLTIKPGKSARVSVPVKLLPQFDDGNLYLTAEVTDPVEGFVTFGSTSNALPVKAGVVSLSATLGRVGKPAAGTTLTITNTGNITDAANFTYTLGFSTDAAGAQPIGQTVVVHLKPMKVGAKRSARVRLNQWASILPSLPSGGRYFLTATVTDDAYNSATAVSLNSFAR